MSESALSVRVTDGRAERIRWRIVTCAQELAIARGYNGFTLDDLAEYVGVSRRTLFNYVESKQQAVLGPAPHHDPELLTVFRAGGPTGDLLDDALVVVLHALERDDITGDRWRRRRDVLNANPDLIPVAEAEYAKLCAESFEHVLARPGETEQRARLVAMIITGLAVEAGVSPLDNDRNATLADLIRRQIPALRSLFDTAPPATPVAGQQNTAV